MRVAAAALVGALVGGAAVLGIGRATGLIHGGSTARTVVVRELAPATSRPAAVRTVIASTQRGFSPARIFAQRSPGVVTVFSYFADGSAAQGSGFVVSPTGAILTNAHVITNAGESVGVPVHAASRIYVEFADHDRIPAKVVGWDVYDDVGVLRVDAAQHALDPLPFGRSSRVVVGEPVAAIGSPLGNENSLAVGVVSAVGRSIAALTAAHFQLIDAIQTDAPITHGSSGGPLLDGSGRVIGINAQIRSDSGGSSGIGFAVPIDSARRSLVDLLAHGRVAYAYAGLQSQNLTPSLARELRLPVAHGALVEHVTPGGPAAKAGIRGGSKQIQFEGESFLTGGDVVVSVDGVPVADADSLVRIVTNRLRPGQTALFGIVRGRVRRSVAVTMAERPSGS